MRVVRALVRRFVYAVFSLIFITFVTFVAGAFQPGDAATIIAGPKASLAQIAVLRHRMGLDLPWPIRYVRYVMGMLHGDFGRSYFGTNERVLSIIERTLPITAEVAFLAILVAASFGILLGVPAAVFKSKMPDKAVLAVSTLGVTVPNFVLAPLLMYLVGSQAWNILPQTWAPASSRVAPEIYYLVLPVLILAAGPCALITRLTRASMVETLQQEFIRLAVAKGVPKWRVVLKHALRNALLPVFTAMGTTLGYLLTGSFVVETAFRIPGIGQQTIQAIDQSDVPVIQACVLVTGVMFLLVNLIVDLIQPLIDPRIREAQI